MTDSQTELFLKQLGDACEADTRKAVKILNEPAAFPLSSWVPGLVSQLFAKASNDRALTIIKVLVTINDEMYSPIIAVEVKRICHNRPVDDLDVSPALLQLWIYQLCCTNHVSVHTALLDAYMVVAKLQGIVQLAIPNLIGIWKDAGRSNSIVAIRCATVFLHTTKICGDSAFELGKESGGTDLILELIKKEDDPLTQLSVLDLFPQVFETTAEIPATQRAWMSQRDVSDIVLMILQDPIVGGAAMQYLSLVAVFDDANVLPALLNFIRSVGPTSSESDRLQVVQALCSLSQHSSEMLETILQDRELRCAWWDVTRTSVPKLKAAILSSIAQTLSNPQNTNAPLLLRLYTLIGQDNSTDATTAWLLQKFAKSPMPELRTAAYAVWTSLVQIPGGCTLLATSSGFVDLIVEGSRESEHNLRIAKFELLHSFHQHAEGFLSAEIAKRLKQNLALGPHGMKTQRWDVATD